MEQTIFLNTIYRYSRINILQYGTSIWQLMNDKKRNANEPKNHTKNWSVHYRKYDVQSNYFTHWTISLIEHLNYSLENSIKKIY